MTFANFVTYDSLGNHIVQFMNFLLCYIDCHKRKFRLILFKSLPKYTTMHNAMVLLQTVH